MSWTVDFVRSWWDIVDLPSVWRLRDHHLRKARGKLDPAAFLNLHLRNPRHEVFLRERGSDFRMFADIFLDGVYAKTVAAMDRCETVVDLGGNIGLTSLYVARHFPLARVFTVEPDRSNFELMNRNLDPIVQSGRCRTILAAAWHSDTANGLRTISSGPGRFMNIKVADGCSGDDTANGVRGLSMDSIFGASGFEIIDLLKIDIEGAEIHIFQNGAPWLDRVGTIAIEFHGSSRQDTNFDAVVTKAGFRVLPNTGDSRVEQHTVVATKSKW